MQHTLGVQWPLCLPTALVRPARYEPLPGVPSLLAGADIGKRRLFHLYTPATRQAVRDIVSKAVVSTFHC